MTITIRLLGPPQVEIDGQPLEVDTRKAIALLAYLATRPGLHSRDHLAGLLWPDLSQERARAVLRRTLSALKAGLGDGALRADRSTVTLDPAAVELDVARFRSLVDAASHATDPRTQIEQLRTALALHRGGFLEGFYLRDSDTFEEWQEGEARALQREVSEGLDSLTKIASGTGDIALAIRSANQRLRLDPLNEAMHRTLMQLHSRAGDRSAAIEQYRECVAMLERELGVEPAQVTTDLYDAIIGGGFEQAPDISSVPSLERSRSSIPLVGRDREIRSLLDAFESAKSTAVVVAIEGEPGVGKTRLLEELTLRARPQTIARARGYRSEVGVAYGAITQLLRSLVTPALLDRLPPATVREVARLLPDVGDGIHEHDHPAGASRFYEAIRATMEKAFEGDGVGLLVVDDAQWLDAASTAVVSYILRRLPSGVCALVAWRLQDMPMSRGLGDAVAGRDGVVIKPERLGRDAIAELVGATHPEAPDQEALTDRLLRETEGLPLFVAEYLLGPIEESEWLVPSSVRALLQ
ncbi:MAG: BTAD domain-containing putative transcriptional regulator, partial [Actinomycetota bacterium]